MAGSSTPFVSPSGGGDELVSISSGGVLAIWAGDINGGERLVVYFGGALLDMGFKGVGGAVGFEPRCDSLDGDLGVR